MNIIQFWSIFLITIVGLVLSVIVMIFIAVSYEIDFEKYGNSTEEEKTREIERAAYEAFYKFYRLR